MSAAFLAPLAALSSPQENYDEKWRWVHFTTEDGLPSNLVFSIAESADSTIWAATSRGLAWYDNFRWNLIDSTKGLPAEPPLSVQVDFRDSLLVIVKDRLYRGGKNGFRRISVEGVQAAVPFSRDSIWILARDTLFIYDGRKLTPFTPFLDITRGKRAVLLSATSGGVWLCTGGSLYWWDGANWERKLETRIDHIDIAPFGENKHGTGFAVIQGLWQIWEWRQRGRLTENVQESVSPVRTMAVGEDDDALAVHESGEIRYRHGDVWRRLTSHITEIHSITSLQFSQNGDLWVCTENGLFFYRRASSRWKYIQHETPDLRDMVNEIIRARDGRIWLGTAGGVEILSSGESRRTVSRIGDKALRPVTGLAEDQSGNIWISSGSGFSGAYRWNGSRWDYFGISDDSTEIFAHKITKDREGRLWFLGISSRHEQPGAYVLDHDQFVHWGTDQGLPSGRVYAFAEDSGGEYWFGTSKGLIRWKPLNARPAASPAGGRWDSLRFAADNDRVFAIAVDKRRNTWFSDRASGLSFVDGNDQVHHFTTAHGLVNNSVWDIKTDESGDLWLTSKGGLSYYKDGVWSNFDYKNGLPNPSLWPILLEKDRVYIGTIGTGLAILDLRETRFPPPRIGIDKPVTEGTTAYVHWHVFPYWGEPSQEDVLARSRVDDGPWSAWEAKKDRAIEGLSPGDHTIQVQAAGLFGDFDPKGTNRAFSIAVPFYRHPAFLAPMAGLAVTVIILGLALTIRKRKHTIALRESELKFRRLTEATFEGIAIHNKGIILDANQSILGIFGCSRDEFVGKSVLGFTAPESREVMGVNMLSDSENVFEAVGMKKDGSKIIVEIIGKAIPYGDRTARVIAVRDITERKRAERRLLEYQSQLQSLASQLSMTEEQERRRMAEYLHEYIGQTLALCKIKLDAPPDAASPENHSKRLEEIGALLDQMIQDTRSLTFELSPPVLYELDFEDAIEWLTEQMEEQRGVAISFENDAQPKPLSGEMRILLFHAVRELLFNVVKHARARRAKVSLQRRDSHIHVVVEDDGIGFKAAAKHGQENKNRGFGLFNIRERLAHFGGETAVDSRPDHGSKITLIAPLDLPEEAPGEKIL